MADDEKRSVQRGDPASSVDAASVVVIPDPASTIDVTCAECGAVVDTVEYDAAGQSGTVALVASALGVEADEAEKIVRRHNPDALKSPEERARAFAKLIAQKKVEGRPAETYKCRNGHDGALEVQP
jgi:acyl-CoA synthetase (NDP forming)